MTPTFHVCGLSSNVAHESQQFFDWKRSHNRNVLKYFLPTSAHTFIEQVSLYFSPFIDTFLITLKHICNQNTVFKLILQTYPSCFCFKENQWFILDNERVPPAPCGPAVYSMFQLGTCSLFSESTDVVMLFVRKLEGNVIKQLQHAINTPPKYPWNRIFLTEDDCFSSSSCFPWTLPELFPRAMTSWS